MSWLCVHAVIAKVYCKKDRYIIINNLKVFHNVYIQDLSYVNLKLHLIYVPGHPGGLRMTKRILI